MGRCTLCNRETARAWAKKSPENRQRLYERIREYEKSKPWMRRQIKHRHKGRLKAATPSWLTREQLKEMDAVYMVCSWYGGTHQVDHIVPIGGKVVCGLHVAWNLQVIPALTNQRKSNKFEEV